MARFNDDDDVQQSATIREALLNYTNETLTQLARAFVGKKPPTRKDELLASLVQLVEGDRLNGLWTSLSPLDRAAVAETAWSRDGVFQPERFRAKYGKLPTTQPGEEEDESIGAMFGSSQYEKRIPSILEVLLPRGVMPRDLQQRLRSFVPKPAAATVKTIEALPGHVDLPMHVWDEEGKKYISGTEAVPLEHRDMQLAAMHDLVSMLRLVAGGKLSLSQKNRWPTPPAIRAVQGVLDGGDFYAAGAGDVTQQSSNDDDDDDEEMGESPGPIRAFAWPMLLQAGEFAKASGGKLALTPSGKAALASPPHEALRALWEQWLGSDLLDELRRVNAIRGQTGKGARFLTDPFERREEIAKALAECPVGQWISLDDFSTYMCAAGHRFIVTEHPYWLYILEREYGYLNENWDILQFRYILCLVMEYAATLGLVDVAFIPPAGARPDYGDLWGTDDLAFFSRYDGLRYLKLNALGAWCLGVSHTYAPPPPESRRILEIRPPRQVIATGPLTPADRMILDAFARTTGPEEWELDGLRILRAAADGRQISELRLFLESASGDAIGGLTASFLSDLEQRLGMFHDAGAARLFHCESSALAHALATDPVSRKTCYRVDEHLLAVPARSESAFRRALEKFGYVLNPIPLRDADDEKAGS